MGAPPRRPVRDSGELARRRGRGPGEGIERLVRRYLQGFGPGAPRDIADWAGLPPRVVSEALDAMELRHFRDEQGAAAGGPAAPGAARSRHARPGALPADVWDATLLVHCRRTQLLPEEHRAKIFHVKAPQSFPTFLVDGAVAGTWRYERGRVELQPFARLARAARAELDEAARALAAFHA